MRREGPPALLPPSVDTWRCAPLNTGKPPPIAMIVYLLGSLGYLGDHSIHAYRHMFGYTTESELGTLYLVVDQGTELYQLSALIGTVNRTGDVGARSCDRLHTSVIRRPPVKSSHYSTSHAMTKLDVLEHLPRDLPAVALLDTDTFCIADCASRLQAQHRAMVRASDTAFVAATRSPPLKSSQNDHTAGTLRDGRDGINSGVLVLDLERMRAFATRYCPHRPWWMCVIDDKNESSYDWHGDRKPLPNCLQSHDAHPPTQPPSPRISWRLSWRPCMLPWQSGSGSICSSASKGCGTSCRVGCTRRLTSFGAQRSSSLWVPPESVRITCTCYAILILKAGGSPTLQAQSWMAMLANIGG